MIEESLAPARVTNAAGSENGNDSAAPGGAVEYWDTVLRWIAYETPATRWLASLQVPDPDAAEEKGGSNESATVRESL
jgi:hypothetical protein